MKTLGVRNNNITHVMSEEKIIASATIAKVSATGASVGLALATFTGMSLIVPMSVGAGVGCLAFGLMKACKKD